MVFNQNDLPHLMGWEKVANGRSNAKYLINQIDDEKFTLASTRKHHNFDSIRNRLLNYNYLHDILLHKMSIFAS
ncbi:PBECR4 domain-containing protein [Lactiplantibacillus songbeiensis]|uniref:PBECR4 domain-containing protein n=1 Tax=Lactiplantibacillus songbeiensis TaxID=2559920 RepID=A0ABW4C0K0_9LACO